MDETAKLIVAILGAGGGGATITLLIKGIGKWITGAAHREQVKNTSLAAQRTKAIEERDKSDKERDEADDKRREAEEHVAMLQRQIILLGAEPVELNSKVN